MPRKMKPISGVCTYCGRACTFPDPGVEMVRTKRRDTFCISYSLLYEAEEGE